MTMTESTTTTADKPTNETVASLRNVSVTLGDHDILTGVDLDIFKGEMLGIIGGNGTGKSTLLKLLVGLLRPSSGDVTVFDETPDSPRVLHRIGSAIDEPALYPWMSGRSVIKTVLDLRGERAGDTPKVLLDKFGLGDAGRKPVSRYSQGMKKRLALAVAAIGEPDLVLLDEPTNALDPEARADINAWLAELRANGTTIVLITHRVSEAETCDRLLRLVGDGTVAQGASTDLHDT